MKTLRASWSGRPTDQAGSDVAPPVRLGNRRVNVDRGLAPLADRGQPQTLMADAISALIFLINLSI